MIDETKLFDTNTQLIKYKVLREIARLGWNDSLNSALLDVPETVVPVPVVAFAFESPVPASTLEDAVLLPVPVVLLDPVLTFRRAFRSCVFWLAVPL